MKIIDGMVLAQVGDDWAAVPTGAASGALHGIVRLNDTAKVVWEGLAEGLTEEQVAKRLTEAYEVDEPTATRSVARVVRELEEAHLLET